MKSRLLIFRAALALLYFGDEVRSPAAESIVARREAVAMYPDLAKAGSPINRKFLELYKRAKENNSPLLDDPDWAINLARQAAAAVAAANNATPPKSPPLEAVAAPPVPTLPPPPFKTEQTNFKVPVGDPPEFDPALPHGGHWKYREFTLNAQVLPPANQIVPEETQAGDAPLVWRTLAALRQAAKAQDLQGFRKLYLPEVWAREIQPALDRGGATGLMRHVAAMAADVRVPVIVEAEGLVIPILDAGAGRVSSLPLRSSEGGTLLIDEPKNLPSATAQGLTDLESALRGFPIEQLVTR